jgi:hypothetical protein
VSKNVYSLHSRLRGENVKVKLYAEYFEVFYGQKKIDRIPRLRGENRHLIQYRHIIDSLVRKPGAFENYRYKEDLFPTIRFRMAYDYLCEKTPARANKEYLEILHLAAKESESGVDEALGTLFTTEQPIMLEAVKKLMESESEINPPQQVNIDDVDLCQYDQLLKNNRVAYGQQA